MEAASRSATTRERRKNGGIESATCVQHNFAAPFFARDACELCRDVANRIIGRGDEDDVGLKDATGNAGKSIASSDGADCKTRGRLRARDNSGNFPIDAMQAAAQDASQTTCSYNRNGGGHPA